MLARPLIISTCIVLLAGCNIEEKPVSHSQKVQANGNSSAGMQAKATVKEIPSWFLTPPKNQYVVGDVVVADLSLFVAGTGTSSNLQLAIDKGVLAAKRQLADQLNSRLRSAVVNILDETGLDGKTYLRGTTRNLIPELEISGYRKVKTSVQREDNRFRSYVLIEFPMGKYNQALIDSLENMKVSPVRLQNSEKYRRIRSFGK